MFRPKVDIKMADEDVVAAMRSKNAPSMHLESTKKTGLCKRVEILGP